MPAAGVSSFTGQVQQANIYSSTHLQLYELHKDGNALHHIHNKVWQRPRMHMPPTTGA